MMGGDVGGLKREGWWAVVLVVGWRERWWVGSISTLPLTARASGVTEYYPLTNGKSKTERQLLPGIGLLQAAPKPHQPGNMDGCYRFIQRGLV